MAGYPGNGGNLPMSAAETNEWWSRIELARKRREKEEKLWQQLLQCYLPPTDGDTLNSNIHFRNTHLKTAEMWAQLPELNLTPLEPLEGIPDPMNPAQALSAEDIVAVKRALLNKLLGPDHANVDHMMQESLFSIFQTAGIGVTKICYEADQPMIEMAMPTGEQVAQPGAILGTGAPPVAQMSSQMVPGPAVHERWRWYHFSEAKFLQPHDWFSTDYDEAPWLAMEFSEDVTPASLQRYHLPADFAGNGTDDQQIISPEKNEVPQGVAKRIKGVEIWLYASRYDATVVNSQIMRRLVLIDGQKEQPAIYTASPYQEVGPDQRINEAVSMIGNPIHPFTLRVCADSAWPKADAAFTDPLVKQENTWAQQDVKMRDANLARFLHAESITTAIEKLENADVGQGVAVPDEKLAQGIEKIIAPLPKLENAMSDIQGRAHLKRATDETLGVGSNQAGAFDSKVRSATESAIVNSNVSVRLKGEQNILMRRFLAGVRKFDALVCRYMTEPGYVQIIGQNGIRRLQAYNQQMLPGKYAYDAKIDTQLTNDPEKRVKKAFNYVNFMAKSPFVDQEEMARLVTAECGYDTGHLVRKPAPPEPEKPKASVALKGEDLINPIALAYLLKTGVTFTPEDIAQAQQLIVAASAVVSTNPAALQTQAMTAESEAMKPNPPHGGAAEKADIVSKHTSDHSGKMDGRAPEGTPSVVAH